jgi:hypothetical protein
MAESKSKRQGKSRGGGSSKSGGSSNGRRRRSARETADDAKKQLQELIGRPVEGVLGMEKDGSDWTVTLEVVELERIPNSTDLLGKYEVTMDRNGELTAARRTRRYPRSEAGED